MGPSRREKCACAAQSCEAAASVDGGANAASLELVNNGEPVFVGEVALTAARRRVELEPRVEEQVASCRKEREALDV